MNRRGPSRYNAADAPTGPETVGPRQAKAFFDRIGPKEDIPAASAGPYKILIKLRFIELRDLWPPDWSGHFFQKLMLLGDRLSTAVRAFFRRYLNWDS